MKLKGIFFNTYNRWHEGWIIAGVIALIATGVIAVIYVLVGVINYTYFPVQEISIEQTRIDIANTGCSAAEDAIGLAISTNRQIREERYWAHHWFTGLAVPNGWDDLELIEIPVCP